MKIIVAMDSFKGTMSASVACARVRQGMHAAAPDDTILCVPMADGGEGTAAALMNARGGEWIPLTVMGPLPQMDVEGGFAWFAADQSVLVEMAVASGLPLLRPAQRNPLLTTTYGTGALIVSALNKGAKIVRLAVGGSATVDGGVGAAMALGWQFLDADGQSIGYGGGALSRIERIVPPSQPFPVAVEVLCDVDSPLTGPQGAAVVFGPQKGATPEMVEQLDAGLAHLAHLVREQLGIEMDRVAGAGAAGGLAAGAIAFMDGKLVPGIDTVMEASGLVEQVKDADWIISGEGRFDHQSMRGKVVSGLVRMARLHAAKVGVIAGSIRVTEPECAAAGLAFAVPTSSAETPFEVAALTAEADLEKTAYRVRQTLL
jgi:glycerate kinase